MVLRQFVFVVGPLEEATLSARERGKPVGVQIEEERERGEERGKEGEKYKLTDFILYLKMYLQTTNICFPLFK